MPDAATTATLTFLFSDIEGSTSLWEAQPDAMSAALARHDALVRQAIENGGGVVFKTVGDAFYAAFEDPGAALTAAMTVQNALAAASEVLDDGGVLRVRMALNTGPAEQRDGDYFGTSLSRTARLLAAAHGGQTLLSDASAKLVLEVLPPGVFLRSLGHHTLKGFAQASEIWELSAPGLLSGFPPLRLLDLFPHNLPETLTSFIGRDSERAAVRAKLADSRLVTLTGVGGTGKTRLALQTAADVREKYPGGTWLVELAALSDPALVELQIAGVLGIREDAGRLRPALLDALRPQPLLLILDNCEHLIDAAARIADTLLKSCPKLSVLATSREALCIGGEAVLPLPPLGLPPPGSFGPEALVQCDSVRLFVERAVAAQPLFRFSAGNAAAVASVCTRLDGIPLALELAAARVKVLTPEQIDGRLNDRFRLLTGGSRTALPRQQTLRALVDWSYELLSPAEQRLLRRLSVFAGGWTLGAAEAVCAGGEVEEEVFDLLSHLAAKSLVVVETPDAGPVRCRLLQSIHLYTAEKLRETPDEAEAVLRKHRDFFLALAEEAEPHLLGASQVLWLDTLEGDIENLRTALAFAQQERDGTLPRLAGALSRFWYGRSYLSEGRSWLEAALAEINNGESAVLGKVLSGAGLLAWCCGDYTEARAYHERDLSIQRGLGSPRGIAQALGHLCIVAEGQKQYAEAERYGQESLAQYQALGDRANSARMLNNMGFLAVGQRDYVRAEDLYRRALAEHQYLYNAAGSATTLHNLGDLLSQQGQYARAKSYFRGSLEAQRTLGNKQQIAATLIHLAEIAGAENRHAEVCFLQAATGAAWEGGTVTRGLDFDPWATLAKSRTALGEEQFAQFWAQGSQMDAAQSIQYVLDNYDGLT